MSFLGVDDRASRSRSKSGIRDRSRSRSNVRVPSPPSSSAYGYAPPKSTGSAMPGSYSNGDAAPSYEVRSPPGTADRANYFSPASSDAHQYPPPPPAPYPSDDGGYTMGDYKDLPPHERPGYQSSQAHFPSQPRYEDDDLAYGANSPTATRHNSYGNQYPPQSQYPGQQYPSQRPPPPGDSAYRYTPQAGTGATQDGSHGYQYAQPPDKITYTTRPQGQRATSYTQSAEPPRKDMPRHYSYSEDARTRDITPGRDQRERATSTSKPHRLSVSTEQQGLQAPKSPRSLGLSLRTDRLSVSGNGHRPDLGNLPPPSPLLEAYHGTYQSLSPMPLALRPHDDDDMSDLEPLDAPSSRKDKARDKLEREAQHAREKDRGGRERKRVTLYDPEEDAKKIARALNHRQADPDPIIETLPGLTHDQTWELRKEYKKQVKIQGKGISLPKHLKMKLAGNFGKAAYVTALGRFESEGYWANFWYQAHGSRRELLIESLMGRTNVEIRNIKDEFKDKRYSDSLTKCMEKELKMDKFRSAVLMVLEERRQEELDVFPPEYVQRDVEMLHRAMSAKQGGESAMLEIIVRRSDAHLRRVLDTYQKLHQDNFARAALRKSNNLVGEVIAHILNGVINKPVRDAMLLNHAVHDIAAKNKDDDLRYELLISRMVRVHWDRPHLERVKRAYYDRFHKHLQDDIEEATKGDFGDYMVELAEAR